MRTKRLLLVGLDWVRPKDSPMSLATVNIAASCTDVCDVQTFTFNIANGEPDFELLPRDHFDVIGIGAYVWADKYMNLALKSLWSLYQNATILIGGPQVTYANRGNFLSAVYPIADGFLRGHGECAMRQFMKGEDKV